jgi:hypothetical protein
MHVVKAEFSLPCRISESCPEEVEAVRDSTRVVLMCGPGGASGSISSYQCGAVINLILSDHQIIRYRITRGDVILLLPQEATQPPRPQWDSENRLVAFNWLNKSFRNWLAKVRSSPS